MPINVILMNDAFFGGFIQHRKELISHRNSILFDGNRMQALGDCPDAFFDDMVFEFGF